MLDRSFNVAVLVIANRLLPAGFDVRDDAPDTLPGVVEYVATVGRLPVWSGASDRTIFGDREVNYAFRAWHDWHHVNGNLAFDLDGETEVAKRQIRDLETLYRGHHRLPYWASLIWAEVVGQATYHREWATFPADQVDFVTTFLRSPMLAIASPPSVYR